MSIQAAKDRVEREADKLVAECHHNGSFGATRQLRRVEEAIRILQNEEQRVALMS